MTRLLLALSVVAAVLAVPAPASAACHWTQDEVFIGGVIRIKFVQVCDGPSTPVSTDPAVATPPRDSDWDAVCVRGALEIGADPAMYCDLPPEDNVVVAAAQLTPGLVARAFRRVDLPAGELIVQPPNGRTLVNFDTNFFTHQGPFTRSVTLLGRHVDLRITPATYTWRFGDGDSRSTDTPGAAYPHLDITHRYLRRGHVTPSVDITYRATYRVDGSPWRPVPGTVTIPGAPQPLRIVTARPVLVGS